MERLDRGGPLGGAGSTEVEGVAGGELRGGEGYGGEVTFVLRWPPTEVG